MIQRALISIIVLALIGAALALSIAAMPAQQKFGAQISQVVNVLAVARQNRAFAQVADVPERNLISFLARYSRFTGLLQVENNDVLQNPWGQPLAAWLLADGGYRLQTRLPSPACYRLADFLGRQSNLGMVAVQVRDARQPAGAAENILPPYNIKQLRAACGVAHEVQLTMQFKVNA